MWLLSFLTPLEIGRVTCLLPDGRGSVKKP
jgi:hypothetical protein